MRIKACTDFYGSITMKKGEIRDVEKDPVISDLLKLKLIKIIEKDGDDNESE